MTRATCDKCNYPINTCICDAITEINNKTKILVLQHPSEVGNKKNTIHLLTLLTKNIQVLVGETEDDFQQAVALCEKGINLVLLYPSEEATIWQQQTTQENNTNKDTVIIIIDGTWRKAKKMYLINNWLHKLPHLKLKSDMQTRYAIRQTSVKNGLSSIEAVAYALNDIENINTTPFITALEGLKKAFTQEMPEDIKKRYKL